MNFGELFESLGSGQDPLVGEAGRLLVEKVKRTSAVLSVLESRSELKPGMVKLSIPTVKISDIEFDESESIDEFLDEGLVRETAHAIDAHCFAGWGSPAERHFGSPSNGIGFTEVEVAQLLSRSGLKTIFVAPHLPLGQQQLPFKWMKSPAIENGDLLVIDELRGSISYRIQFAANRVAENITLIAAASIDISGVKYLRANWLVPS